MRRFPGNMLRENCEEPQAQFGPVRQKDRKIAALVAAAEVLYRTRDDIRNRWLDFSFQIRFSRSQAGRIKAWLGDAMVVDYRGATAYAASGGYVAPAAFYFKMGLYRDRSPDPMTIYVDEYRKRLLDAFAP